jgi:hypothetical protein
MRSEPSVRSLIVPSVLAVLIGALASSPSPALAACPNEAIRQEQLSTALGDCRGYEMVSPLEKNGGDVEGIDAISDGGVVEATPDGSRITYLSFASFATAGEAGPVQPAGAPVASQYLSTRDVNGWSTQNISPPMSSGEYAEDEGTPYKIFSSDLSLGLLPNAEGKPPQSPPLGGAPAGYDDDYLRNFSTGGVQALLTAPPAVSPASFGELTIEGATPDLSGVVVSNSAALAPGATAGGQNLYEWLDGGFQAINVPVNPGETTPSASLGSGRDESHTISNDGSRVFWSNGSELFLREGVGAPAARTVQVDATIGGGGVFWTASADGSKAFFTNGSAGDLYEYDADSGQTTNLAPGGEVVGVVGASADGEYVYFVGNGVLAPDAEPGDCPSGGGPGGESGEMCNLYVSGPDAADPGERVTTFIARLSGEDEAGSVRGGTHDWSPALWARTARVTPDGRNVVFMSSAPIAGPGFPAGFDNLDAITGGRDEEVYDYELGASAPVCVSCNRNGQRPLGGSSVLAGASYSHGEAAYAARDVSDDGGRVFFDSSDTLAPQDVNGQQDVYEWEREGEGSCPSMPKSSPEHDAGCQFLVSSGTSDAESAFLDASASGGDVFFITRQQLVASDTDQLVDLYDAREDGGAQPVAPTAACQGAGCVGQPGSPPVLSAPGSLTFNGSGNLPPKSNRVRLTRAQKLSGALRACTRKPRRRRAQCRRKARERYGPIKVKKT